jgi:Rrf2 family iron-sulfur cluster assembly transcriptional regulator
MRLTIRSRCALVAITAVALRCSSRPVALSSVSARHGISLSYLKPSSAPCVELVWL